MDKLIAEYKRVREEEIKELKQMWAQQQLYIEKRKAFLETLKESN